MLRLLGALFLLCTSCSILLAQSTWEIKASNIDPNNYYGVTTANGMIGMISSAEPLTKKYAQEIDQRKQIFKKTTGSRKNLFVTLITPYGARRNEHFLAEITNELKLEALF